MERNFAVRITLPYVSEELNDVGLPDIRKSVRTLVQAWSFHVQYIVVYEHDDDGANHIHCHIMLENSRLTKKRLQQIANENCDLQVLNPGHRATSLMSFRSKDYDGNVAGFAYCTKGKYDPKYIKGWTVEQADEWKAAWVAPVTYQKRGAWRVMWELFNSWWNAKENRLDYDAVITYSLISARAHKFILAQGGGLYEPKAKTQRWFLVTNMCLHHHVDLPKDWKM